MTNPESTEDKAEIDLKLDTSKTKIILLFQNENFLAFFTGMTGIGFIVALTHVMAFIQSGSFETIGGVNLAVGFAFSSLLIGYHIGEIRAPTQTEMTTIDEKIKNGYLVLGIFVGIIISISILVISLDGTESDQVLAISAVAIIGIISTLSANLSGLINRYDDAEVDFEKVTRFFSGLGIYQFIHTSLLTPIISRFLDGEGDFVDLIFLIALLAVILVLVQLFIIDIKSRVKKYIDS